MRHALIALCLATAACGSPPAGKAASQDNRIPVWTLTGLADPESVALAADGRSLYVANVAGEGDVKDGNGFISRVSLDGKMLEREWVKGLDAPKGAIVKGGRLFVSDIDQLVEIDAATAKVVARYPVPGAKFLNDVAVAPDGTVLVADSGTARILQLKDGAVSVWSADPELRSVNGLLPEADRLLVTTMEGKFLAFDYGSKAVKVLAKDLGQADGVARAVGDSYFVSEWPGRLFLVAPDGTSRTLFDSRAQETYINDFIKVGDLLIIPSWKPGMLRAYRIPMMHLVEAAPAKAQRAAG